MGAINFFAINGAGAGGGSGTVVTSNGISGDGSTGSPIILGGNDIDQDTNFIIAGKEVSFQDTSQPDNNLFLAFGAGDPFLLRMTASLSQTQTELQVSPIAASLVYRDLNAGTEKHLNISSAGVSGITVADGVDNIGLLGNVVFPLNGNPAQYLQAGNAQPALNVASQDTAGETTTQIIPPPYTLPVDSIIRVNPYVFTRSGTGTVDILVWYFDVLNNFKQKNLGTFGTGGNPNSEIAPLVIKAKQGTDVSVVFSVTGTVIYDAGATIENLFA